MEDFSKQIINAEILIDHFGKWPSFHDTEIIELTLNRKGPDILITFYLFEMLNKLDEKGSYQQTNCCSAQLKFHNAEDIKLFGFNIQNVIFELSMEKNEKIWNVKIAPTFGLSLTFKCLSTEVLGLRRLPNPNEKRE